MKEMSSEDLSEKVKFWTLFGRRQIPLSRTFLFL